MCAYLDRRLHEPPWVIAGCGYTGKRLGRRLLEAGAKVWATARSADAVEGIRAALGRDVALCALDLSAGPQVVEAAAEPASAIVRAMPLGRWIPSGAIIVDLAPPVPGSTAGEGHLLAAAQASGARRIVYVSSTGVYPPGDGSWVDEDSPVGSTTGRGSSRLAAETLMIEGARERGIQAVALRVAGIYGPGRGVPTRLHAGTYRIIGAGDTYVSRIHVDDLVSVILAAGSIPELPRSIYNVADDEPETSRVYADAVADLLGVARPPSVPTSAVDPWVAAMMGANRRIANRRMKQDLGVTLKYPSWREGLTQIMAEEGIPGASERAGQSSPGS